MLIKWIQKASYIFEAMAINGLYVIGKNQSSIRASEKANTKFYDF